ncbi:hypothetical protein AGMMS50212_12710 [Spirochaetia bacterium]|nr:hypothetical protein AGMMS50212_12710 [Spirochaetia bacterium]
MFYKAVKKIFIYSVLLLSSCGTSGIYYRTGHSWSRNDSANEYRSVRLGTISTDKSGGNISIENEVLKMLPLLFLEKGFVFNDDQDNANYIIDVHIIEHDYFVEWKPKKSVSIEVDICGNSKRIDGSSTGSDSQIKLITPLAAGKITVKTTQGLASSHNLEKLLRASVRKAIKALKKSIKD